MGMRETEEGLLFEDELSTTRQLPENLSIIFQLTSFHSIGWNADGSVTSEWEGEDGVRHKEVAPPVPFKIPDGYEWRMRGDEGCEVYWGSHGCALRKGHEGDCFCECAFDNDGNRLPCEDDEGCRNVGGPPYYGAGTRFYGDDMRPSHRLQSARGELRYLGTNPHDWWRFRVGRRVPYRLRRLRCQLFGHRLQSDGVCTTCWILQSSRVSSEE